MKDIDDFNKLEEQAWRYEKMLSQKGLNEPNKEEAHENSERCRKCLSGEMQIFCEVCTYE
jgi:hypothetical protein